MTLAELQAKYPQFTTAKYEPRAECRYCGGRGEVTARSGRQRICVCVCVRSLEAAYMVQEAMNNVARAFHRGIVEVTNA